jgi:TetR/AcrR family transcriptional regulator
MNAASDCQHGESNPGGSGSNRRQLRRERERLRHRREMLEAAERVFVRKGYHGATVEEIAHEAEFAVGTIYNFFDSKDHLYTEVTLRVAEDFFGVFHEQVVSNPDPLAAVRALVELRLRHFQEHCGFFRIFFDTMPGSRLDLARALPDNCRPLYERYIESLNAVFARGIEAGGFERQDPLYLTLCVDGVINAFIGYWSCRETAQPDGDQIEQVTRTILKAVGGKS